MICGAFGIILRTTDGGETWLPESSGTDYDLSRISCTGARNGTAVGEDGTIVRTTDGGNTWVPQTSGTLNDLLGLLYRREYWNDRRSIWDDP